MTCFFEAWLIDIFQIGQSNYSMKKHYILPKINMPTFHAFNNRSNGDKHILATTYVRIGMFASTNLNIAL